MGKTRLKHLTTIFGLLLLSLLGCGSSQTGGTVAQQNRVLLTEGTNLQILPDAGTLKTYLQKGGAKYVVAFVLDENEFQVTNSLFSPGFLWSSSDPSVATVNPTTGLIRGVENGQATISVSFNGLVDSGVVTVLATGGRGGAIQGRAKVTVLSNLNDGPLQDAVVDIGGRIGKTDQNGEAVIIDPGMAGPQDIHVFLGGFATTSIYQINNDDIVLTLTPFVPPFGIVTGSVLGRSTDNSAIASAGGVRPPMPGNQYVIPNPTATDLNGLPRAVPSLAMASRFLGVSVFTFSCLSNPPQPTQFAGSAGFGPVDVRFPLLQTFDLTPRPVFVTTGVNLQLPFPFNFTANMDGAQVTPIVNTSARGTGSSKLNAAKTSLTFSISVSGLSLGSITEAHFHNAAAGTAGSVVRTITVDSSNNSASGVWRSTDSEPLTPTIVSELAAGRIYVDIHTSQNPSGEIRGQVTRASTELTSADLQEIQGYAFFDQDGEVQTGLDANRYCKLHFDNTIPDRAGLLTSVHIPGAAYYWVQVSTDPAPKTTEELKKGLSLARATNLTQYPPGLTLSLMPVPNQLSPDDTISGSVGVTPDLQWENTAGKEIAYYEVLLSDAGPLGTVRGNVFWKLTVPGSPAGEITTIALPPAPKEATADSGVVVPGSLVNWSVTGYDNLGYRYDLQSGGFLNGYATSPKHIFRP